MAFREQAGLAMEVSKPQDGGRREGSFRERPERQWRHAHAFGYYPKEKEIGK